MLKKLTIIIVIFTSCMQFLYSQEDSIASKIVIFREPNYMMSALSFKVFANNNMIAKLSNNTYYEYYCGPGEYTIFLKENPNSKVKLNVEEGKTYYIRLVMISNFWRAVPELIVVDSEMAETTISKMGMRKIEETNTSLPRPKNRLGLNFNVGGGFSQIPMFVMTNGDESTISFGGGLAFGLQYGYEVGKYFDIAADLNYQFTTLTPLLDNATVNFGRGTISITPSLIIPIDGGYSMRLKLGGGINYNFAPKLVIESDQLSGGYNDTWTYKAAPGLHVTFLYEINYTEKLTAALGLKYTNVQYEFESSKDNRSPGIEFSRPDGQGLELVCGIYYHF